MTSPWQQTPHNLCWDLRECKIRIYIYIYLSIELNIFCNSHNGGGGKETALKTCTIQICFTKIWEGKNEKPTPHACLLLCQLGKLCHPTQQQTAVENVELYQIPMLQEWIYE